MSLASAACVSDGCEVPDPPAAATTRRVISRLWPCASAPSAQLIQLRWVAVLGTVVAVATGGTLGTFDDPMAILAVAAALAAINAGWASGLIAGSLASGVAAQLLVDVTALTLLLHLAGGVANPLVMLYMVHAILAAILLPRRQSYLVAGYACMAFKMIAVGEMLGWFPHHGLYLSPGGAAISASLAMNPRYVLLLIGTCAGLMGVSVYFVGGVMEGLRSRESALRRTRGQLHAAINSIQDGIVLFDGDGVPVACNRAIRPAGCLCESSQQRGGCQAALLGACPAYPQWPFEISAVQAMREFEQGSVVPTSTETQDGELRYRHRLFPVDRADEGVRLVWVREDVSEQRHLETQARHQDRMAAVGLLAAGIAHEIRNPLASISAIVEDTRATSVDEEVRDDLGTVGSQVHRISRILGELNGFARPPSAERSVVDPAEVIREALRIGRFDPQSRSVEIIERLDAPVPTIVANRDQLLQVCINLVLNAFEAMSSMSSGGSLTVTTAQTSDGVELLFQDSGPGVPAEVAEHVFDPFFTTKRKGDGAGLGLSVSANIVRAHGGSIEVESEAGHGATFRVHLPSECTANAEEGVDLVAALLDPGEPLRPTVVM